MIIAIIVLLLAAFLLYVAALPDQFRVERSLALRATPEQIFPLINDFHEWEAWSPWEKIDPAVRRTYDGPAQGKGGSVCMEWQ